MNGKELEEYVEHVYKSLLANENLKDKKIIKNHHEIGLSGTKHEFDILYEITVVGIIHRVGIECKNHKRPVTKGKVQEFKGKLDDFNNIQGVMVSANGYQAGAYKIANQYGIKLFLTEDLPKINEILALAIKVMLPNNNIKGEPFWVIMQIKDEKNIGSYFSFNNKIILFLSKKSAERIISRFALVNFDVFGVSHEHLKAICYLSKVFGYKLCICSRLLRSPKEQIIAWDYSFDDILDEFVN